MKAPINYFGGKNIMFKYIIDKFPNRETYDIYIEPFGGSYAVGLNMLSQSIFIVKTINIATN